MKEVSEMVLFRRILVGDQERVLMTRKGRFARIFEPGEYWVWTLGQKVQLQKFNVRDMIFQSEWTDYLAKEQREVAERLFVIVETGDAEVAVVSYDGKVTCVVGPGRRILFWRGSVQVTARLIQIQENPEVPRDLLPALTRIKPAQVTFATVEDGKVGILFVDGGLVRTLEAGNYGFWNVTGAPKIEAVDLRLQAMEIPGQEILTRDKVSIRVNIWAEYQVMNAVRAKQTVKDYGEALYRALQLAVRQTLGKRSLEEILAEKVEIEEPVAAGVRREMDAFGVRVGAMALKDIILPGDMREILNQVVTAEKQAQANLIRRREETAATRSLLNTAKLMEDNPLLVRLKELETLEKVAEKVQKINVLGGFDTLLQQVVQLRQNKNGS
jgi:regulator of protease activity HflC (stomatin/prohibitin superfamily)